MLVSQIRTNVSSFPLLSDGSSNFGLGPTDLEAQLYSLVVRPREKTAKLQCFSPGPCEF